MPAASAAVALAQLHNSGSQLDFDPDQVRKVLCLVLVCH